MIARRGLLRLALLGGAALLPAACGRKGPIGVPEGQEEVYTYPRTYPDPATVVPDYKGPDEQAPGEAPIDQPPRDFEDVDEELSIDNP